MQAMCSRAVGGVRFHTFNINNGTLPLCVEILILRVTVCRFKHRSLVKRRLKNLQSTIITELGRWESSKLIEDFTLSVF